jgi:hypothetical protein
MGPPRRLAATPTPHNRVCDTLPTRWLRSRMRTVHRAAAGPLRRHGVATFSSAIWCRAATTAPCAIATPDSARM